MNNLLYWEVLRDVSPVNANLDQEVIERIERQEYDDIFNVEKWYVYVC